MFKAKTTTFKNGLRLITVPMAQAESLTVLVGVAAGSRFETRRVNGLFHFLEHMAFKGTKKRPSTLAIATAIDSVGGQFNAFTDKEFTGYYVKLAAKHQKLALDILSDMLKNSLLKSEEIERERGVIIEEINLYQDTPLLRIATAFERLLYGDNAMGWDIAGEKETVAQIKRDDFVRFLHQLYFPQNMVVVMAGKVTDKTAKGLVTDFFGQDQRRGKKQTKAIKLLQKKPKIKLISKKTEQAHFCLGVPGFSYQDPDRWPLTVLSAVLGSGMSSRLFIEIRERRGLAYYVRATPEFHTDSGYLVIQAGVRLKQIKEALKVVLAELASLKQKKVSDQELKKAKEFLKGNLVLSLEDSQKVATRFAYQLLLEGKLRTLVQTMNLIDQVTTADVRRVARKLLQTKKLNLALIGPYQNQADFRKQLVV